MGAITDIVRRYVPATYRALVESTSPTAQLFSTADVQALADYVKFRLFATVVNEQEEETVYDPMVRQFIGKIATLHFIPPAIDYWDSQLASKNLTGPNESVAYRDHLEGLKHLYEVLSRQVADEFLELAPEYGFTIHARTLVPKVSYGDNGRGILVTPDPQTFGGPFSRRTSPHYLDLLPWRTDI